MENPFHDIHVPENIDFTAAVRVATEAERQARRALVIAGHQVAGHITELGMILMMVVGGSLLKYRIDADLSRSHPSQYRSSMLEPVAPTAIPGYRLDIPSPKEKIEPVLTVAEYVRIASQLITEKGLNLNSRSLAQEMADNGYTILNQWPFLLPLEQPETLTVGDKPIKMQRIPVDVDDTRFGADIVTETLSNGDKFTVYSILVTVDQDGKTRVMVLTDRFKATPLQPGEPASDAPNMFHRMRLYPAWAQIGSDLDIPSSLKEQISQITDPPSQSAGSKVLA